ncbi:transcription antitermination factor NusB [Mucisphaera calidilacus]|uniref:NusB/RsmB/TIM44 domain-containing protein n=1 Tax=Mucisphaera calidilacus TaxID=2527982 RepID=A0A518BYC0_9BACT|nr:transcription antitermination factor NusB [Mucisphaera calidilacus]QDU71973.1 hypothetical protein Pan265_18320 [Mucisphaera calidilacus]
MKQQLRLIRRLAMQTMYQVDVTGEEDAATLLEGVSESGLSDEERRAAIELALAAWGDHARADVVFTELAPDWPTHRQPPVDRAILRLAHHELVVGRVSSRVAINEAVELAKTFCSEESPAFVNALLDKAAKRIADGEPVEPLARSETPATAEAWLSDALHEEPKG